MGLEPVAEGEYAADPILMSVSGEGGNRLVGPELTRESSVVSMTVLLGAVIEMTETVLCEARFAFSSSPASGGVNKEEKGCKTTYYTLCTTTRGTTSAHGLLRGTSPGTAAQYS